VQEKKQLPRSGNPPLLKTSCIPELVVSQCRKRGKGKKKGTLRRSADEKRRINLILSIGGPLSSRDFSNPKEGPLEKGRPFQIEKRLFLAAKKDKPAHKKTSPRGRTPNSLDTEVQQAGLREEDLLRATHVNLSEGGGGCLLSTREMQYHPSSSGQRRAPAGGTIHPIPSSESIKGGKQDSVQEKPPGKKGDKKSTSTTREGRRKKISSLAVLSQRGVTTVWCGSWQRALGALDGV